MATFTISLPDSTTTLIDEEAARNHRSRVGQVKVIIDEWLGKERGLGTELAKQRAQGGTWK